MKKIISLLLCIAMLISLGVVPVSAETFAKEWDFEGSVSGFGGNNSTLSSVDGNLVQTITTAKNNTWLLSPNNLGVDASVYKYLKVRVKNSTTANGLFRFEATGTNKSAFAGAWVPVEDNTTPNDGEWHEYIVDLSQYGTEWSGTISRFRLCMSAWNCEGTVEYDYIILSDTSEPVEDEGDITVPDDESTFSVSPMFGSGCVIQRDVPYEVWGSAIAGERVTVSIGNETVSAVTDDNGKWTVELPALSLSDMPYTMTVSTESGEMISYEDILAGDVWLCSGQSNMQWSVQQVDGAAENIANAENYKNIRIFKQSKSFASEPLDYPIDAQWYICNSDSVKTCSAIGYNFAKEINESENVPIGILNASYGGQMIERFIENSAIANGKYSSRATSIDYPSGIYNSMIAPLTRYRIKGVLWYQGESDSTSEGNRERYPYFQQLLLDTWESNWGFEKGTMPFLFAQLTSYGELDYKEIREFQHRFALDNPNTAMAVLMDCGDESNLHPKNKVTPAHRLALAALNKVYGHEDVEYKYPYAVDFALNENAVTVTFTDVYDGLKCNGEVAGFKLCGSDGVFYDAEAVITSENTIRVVCDEVSKPKEIRYGYEAFPKPTLNLYNSADIPACPFAASVKSNDLGLSWINPIDTPSNKPLGEEISLEVASDVGTPDSVEYFANGVSIGSANAAPYTVSWTPQQTGGYYITAVASFDGTTVTSEERYINVYDGTLIEDSTYYWQFDNSVQDFFGNNSTVSSENGCLVQTITTEKNNTWLLSPNNLGIDASTYKYLKVRVRNTTTAPGLFRFEATGTNKSAFTGTWVPVENNVTPNDGEWHEYVVDLSQYGSEWSGTISRFRLCMSAWNTEGKVEFDYIRLSDTGLPKEDSYAVSINSLNAVSDKPLGTPIALTAGVEGGTASKVEYFAEGVSIGSATEAPYTFNWNPAKTGGYHITATATIDGTPVDSEKVYVNVYDPEVVEKSAYYWQFNSTTQGWAGNNSTMTVENGCLVQSVAATKVNSFLVSPSGLGIDASKYKYVKLRVAADYSAAGQLAIQWTTSEDTAWDTGWGEGSKTKVIGTTAVTNDGEFYDYIFDLSQHTGWKDSITRLRIKVTPWSDKADMEAKIDYIRVSDTLANGIDENDVPKPMTTVSFNTDVELESITVYDGAQYTDEVILGTPDGKYTLPAGLYTYTAVTKDAAYGKIHKNFVVTDEDVNNGTKVITVDIPQWQSPGYWQVKTMFFPTDEISKKFFADPAPEIVIDTPAFKEGRRINSFTTQEEVDAFVAAADEAAANMWTTVIGTSNNDLNIHLAIFSKGADNNANWADLNEAADALHKLGKPIVWVGAQVHGNEVSSGESALALINELSGEWGDDMLENVSVVVIPRINPKGAMYNRRTPNGDNDINRDRIKVELQETQAINAAYWLLCPEVAIDAHEYGAVPRLFNGKNTYAAQDFLFSGVTNRNVSDELRAKCRALYQDTVHEKLATYGIRSMDYYDGTVSSTMTESGGNPKTNTNANALLPSFSFLAETLVPGGGFNSMLHFDRRVKTHLITAKTVIEVTADNADDVKDFIAEERASLLNNAGVYDEDDIIVLEQSTKEELIDFDYIDMETATMETSKVKWYSYTNGSITKSVTRPTAYILPKTAALETAVAKLKAIGVEIDELPAGETISTGIQKYIVTSSKVSTTLSEGAYLNTVTADIADAGSVTFADGAYIVPMKQNMTNLIGIALEPEHESGYVSFRIIDVADVAVGEELPYYRYTLTYPQETIEPTPDPEIEISQGEDATIVNINIERPENAVLIAALYDEAGQCISVNLIESDKVEFAKTLSGTVKVFVWSDIVVNKPLRPAISKEISTNK